MLAKRLIPCLDVKDGQVVKGVQFRQHCIVGDILTLAERYSEAGADELVFYDITASSRTCDTGAGSQQSGVDPRWVERVAKRINIPFCVAGGIRSLSHAQDLLYAGADKISLNSPALENPKLINQLSHTFGAQAVVVGIDSYWNTERHEYQVKQYTGDQQRTQTTSWETTAWLQQAQSQGAGEIVLNCINQDGMRQGYDIQQLKHLRRHCRVPLIASGGAGTMAHFYEVFSQTQVEGALAASVFHQNWIELPALKAFLAQQGVEVRQ